MAIFEGKCFTTYHGLIQNTGLGAVKVGASEVDRDKMSKNF